MKKLLVLTLAIVSLGLAPAFAQPGAPGGGQGADLGGPLGKLFGTNQSFSALMEFQTAGADGERIIIPGKISFDTGKSRFEMNMSEVQGAKVPPNQIQQVKELGMDTMISISRPDLKLAYLVNPGVKSYAEMPAPESSASLHLDDYKLAITELGKEIVDGHDCVKHKDMVTDQAGNQQEYTVWNASDLKAFPVKIVTGEAGHPATYLFKNVSLAKPAASQFEAPAGFTKYDSPQTMMVTETMKKMGGGMGKPPGQ